MAEFGGKGTVQVEASRERCFEVAAAVESYPDWHPVIDSIEALEPDAGGRPHRARAVVDAGVSTVRVVVAFEYDPPNRVECRRESGDLREMSTSFEFAELGPGRTRVDYETGLDPGRMLSLLATGSVVEKVRHKLVDEALAGFKRTVEQS
jgi:ribosome-associated toxin RatA of RatAB toxin-antitoxin module